MRAVMVLVGLLAVVVAGCFPGDWQWTRGDAAVADGADATPTVDTPTPDDAPTPTDGSPACLGLQLECVSASQCCGGASCRPTAGVVRCCREAAQPCASHDDCCGGMACGDAGTCACQGGGATCVDSRDCCGGSACTGGVCACRTGVRSCTTGTCGVGSVCVLAFPGAATGCCNR